MPSSSKLLVGLLAAASAIAAPGAAEAFSPFLTVPDPSVAEATPAYRYANLADADALAELDRRRILYSRVDAASAPGVRAPVRLTGRLHGVNVHSALPPDQRVVSPFEILDARLALALDDFCALLERHDIDEVVHYTMYRPNVPLPHHSVPDEASIAAAGRSGGRHRQEARASLAPGMAHASVAPKARPPQDLGKGTLDAGKVQAPSASAKQKSEGAAAKPEPAIIGAKKPAAGKAPAPVARETARPSAVQASPPPAPPAPAKSSVSAGKRVARRDPPASGLHQTTWAPPGTRHPAGLAIDVALLRKRDGRWLSVGRHFRGRIGERTCGEGARVPEDADARELRALVCESSDLGLFTYVLTPDYNAAHADHFHMEIKPGVHWFLYH